MPNGEKYEGEWNDDTATGNGICIKNYFNKASILGLMDQNMKVLLKKEDCGEKVRFTIH